MRAKKLKPGARAWSYASNSRGYYIYSVTLIQRVKKWNCSWIDWEFKTDSGRVESQMETLMFPSFLACKKALIKHLHDLIDMKQASMRSAIKELEKSAAQLTDYNCELKKVEQLEEQT